MQESQRLPRYQAPTCHVILSGVFAEQIDSLEDSCRRSGAHGGFHGVGLIWSATG